MLTAILNVKNEAKTIGRCLRAAAHVVDQALVIDTGSTDGTPEILESLAHELRMPLHVEHSPWLGWSVNRPQLFERARELDPDGVSLLLDADEIVVQRGPRGELNADGGMICRVWPGENEVWGMRMFRNSARWAWSGEVHEVPVGGTQERVVWLEVDNRNDWAASTPDHERHARYASEAEHFANLLTENPNDSRAAYYRAQSLMDAGQHGAAYVAFGARGAMLHGFDEERYLSLLKVAQYRCAWQWPAAPVINAFHCAIESRPQRWEARCQLAEYLLRTSGGLESYPGLLSGPDPLRPMAPSGDLFLVHRPSETWLPMFLRAVAEHDGPGAGAVLDIAPNVGAQYRQQLQELITHVVHR